MERLLKIDTDGRGWSRSLMDNANPDRLLASVITADVANSVP